MRPSGRTSAIHIRISAAPAALLVHVLTASRGIFGGHDLADELLLILDDLPRIGVERRVLSSGYFEETYFSDLFCQALRKRYF